VGRCGAAVAAPTTSYHAFLALTAAVLSIDTGGGLRARATPGAALKTSITSHQGFLALIAAVLSNGGRLKAGMWACVGRQGRLPPPPTRLPLH
jgi:hypothetical protein